MKDQDMLLNTLIESEEFLNGYSHEEIGDDHLYTGLETPMKPNAFLASDEEKKESIAQLFAQIMDVMGLDLNDDSLKGTPERVAKIYIDEIFSGLDPKNKPKVALFDNKYQYNQMLVEKDITFYSNCEHHFVPIIGKAHVGYVPDGRVLGLSKIARVVDIFARRLQTQESMTAQIAHSIQDALEPKGVAVMIEAEHMCMAMRGIRKQGSTTLTTTFTGSYKDDPQQQMHFMKLAD